MKYSRMLLNYYGRDILMADFDVTGTLVVFINPYIDFDGFIMDVCEGIMDSVYFSRQLRLHLYPFGTNECVSVSIK